MLAREVPLLTYGVCCNSEDNCSLSYQNSELNQLKDLLQLRQCEGLGTFGEAVAGFTKFFQKDTMPCSACHSSVLTTAQPTSPRINNKRLKQVLGLRNQLLGLEILLLR
jgi:hypothetical protein